MTLPELLRDSDAARSGIVLWTRTHGLAALVTYEAAETGECDGCGGTFAAGDAIIGLHDSGMMDARMSKTFRCAECGAGLIEVRRTVVCHDLRCPRCDRDLLEGSGDFDPEVAAVYCCRECVR